MQNLLEQLDGEEWIFKYNIMATKIYMHSFQKELATEHINECKRLSDSRNDDKMKFELALLEHMVFFQGWRDHWLLNISLPGLDSLIEKCIAYGYDNHLAHIYVYAIPKEKQLSCSIAIAMGSIDTNSDKKLQIQNILKKADTMMYRVKHSTKNSYMYYDY